MYRFLIFAPLLTFVSISQADAKATYMEFLFFVETHPSLMYASYFVVAVFCQSTSRQSPNAKIILSIHLFFFYLN